MEFACLYEYELECYEALVDAMTDDTFRCDLNAAYSVFDAVKIACRVRDLPNDYLEDPTSGLGALRQVRREGTPIATNTVVVDFEQLETSVHSSGELGIRLATMLHLAASLPTLGFAIDAHYHKVQVTREGS